MNLETARNILHWLLALAGIGLWLVWLALVD
jgi:hypothetical protein